MAVRIKNTTKEYLLSVPLPVYTDTYTVITHGSIMEYVQTQLTQYGFSIKGESFRCTADGNIAQGVYYLNHGDDEEIGMMFAWANSYNKTMRFKCAIGGYVHTSLSSMITGDLASWGRKHSGTADIEAHKTINEQISNANVHFDQLIIDKNIMKEIILTTKRQAELLGVLYAEYGILNTEQISVVKQEIDKPSFFYNGDVNSLWSFYNHVTLALKRSHPVSWMESQRTLHWFLAMEFDLINFTLEDHDDMVLNEFGQPENQINILDQIAEMESQDMISEQIIIEADAYEEVTSIEEQLTNTIDQEDKPLMSARVDFFDLSKPEEPVVNSLLNNYGEPENQTNLLVQITEITGDKSVLEPTHLAEQEIKDSIDEVINQYPLTPDDVISPVQEEVVEDVIKDIELSFDIDEDDDAVLGSILVPISPIEYKAENPIVDTGDSVKYQDPAGNTFEAPIVTPSAAHNTETEEEFEEFKAVVDNLETNSVEEEMIALETSSFFSESELNADEPTLDLSDLEGEYSLEEAEKVVETIQERIEAVEPEVAPERVKFALDETEEESSFAWETPETLEPTNEEYLLIEKELDQEKINEDIFFETHKPVQRTEILDAWDLSLSKDDSEEKDTGEFFL